jgi:predicted kinase
MTKLVIIRGAAGSGKSTYAQKFVAAGYVRVESDDFFTDHNGIYKWDGSRLPEVFHKQLVKVTRYLFSGQNVVMPGCFTKLSDMKDYINFCHEYGIEYEIHEMKTQYQNIHDVPEEKVQSMIARFQPYAGAIHVT